MPRPIRIAVPLTLASRLRLEWDPDQQWTSDYLQDRFDWIRSQGGRYIKVNFDTMEYERAIYYIEFDDPELATAFILKYV